FGRVGVPVGGDAQAGHVGVAVGAAEAGPVAGLERERGRAGGRRRRARGCRCGPAGEELVLGAGGPPPVVLRPAVAAEAFHAPRGSRRRVSHQTRNESSTSSRAAVWPRKRKNIWISSRVEITMNAHRNATNASAGQTRSAGRRAGDSWSNG